MLRDRRVALAPAMLTMVIVLMGCGGTDYGNEGWTGGAAGTTGEMRDPQTMLRTEGGERYFKPPSDLQRGEPVCTAEGTTYLSDTTNPISWLDAEMKPFARCENLDIPVYSPAADDSDRERVYLRTSPGHYVRLQKGGSR